MSIKSTLCFNLHKNYYSHLLWVISHSLITRACSALDFSSLLLLLLISSILLARITPTWGGAGVIVQRLLIFYYHWKENFKKKCYSHISVRFKVGCWGNRLECHERALPTQAVLRRHARPWTQSYLTRGFQDKSRTASLWPSSEFCNFCKIIITLLNTLAALQDYKNILLRTVSKAQRIFTMVKLLSQHNGNPSGIFNFCTMVGSIVLLY